MLVALYWDALASGGWLLVLAGSAGREEDGAVAASAAAIDQDAKKGKNGPPLLTSLELSTPFLRQGFELVSLTSTRFDSTEFYKTLPECPLAWCALFRKP